MKLVNFIIRSTITQIKICCCRVEDNTQQSPYSHFHIGILISWDNILVSNSQLLVVDNQGIQPQNPQYPSYPIPPIDLSHIKIYFCATPVIIYVPSSQRHSENTNKLGIQLHHIPLEDNFNRLSQHLCFILNKCRIRTLLNLYNHHKR